MKKINVAILFGGKSAEHEVSIQSAKNVYNALDREKYYPILIGIDKTGNWINFADQKILTSSKVQIEESNNKVALVPKSDGKLLNVSRSENQQQIDVVFPVLHGTMGEDGTIQGLLKLAGIPFVGADVLGSAIGMDKVIMKKILRDAMYPIANFLSFKKVDRKEIEFAKIKKALNLPFYVKPANTGSSVGVHKVKNENDFDKYLTDAFQFDNKIIFEENIEGREIECSVLGNEDPIASVPGEVITKHEFYSYEAKYLDEEGSRTEIPAKISKSITKKIQNAAIDVFGTLECSGMARVDFFLQKNEKIIVNEINTIPGFTKISMYPKLWEASGISYTELIDKLIYLAIDKFKKDSKIKTEY